MLTEWEGVGDGGGATGASSFDRVMKDHIVLIDGRRVGEASVVERSGDLGGDGCDTFGGGDGWAAAS